MEAIYLTQLPKSIQKKVEEIECLTKTPIIVRRRKYGDVASNEFDGLDCYMQDGIMTVTILTLSECIAAHTLIHEVLHAWRKIVMRVPWLFATDSARGIERMNASIVDNDIEHIFIIHEEISSASEALNYWNNLYAQKFSELLQPINFLIGRGWPCEEYRSDILRHALITEYIPGLPIRDDIMTLVDKAGFTGDYDRMHKEVAGLIGDKATFTTATLEHLRLKTDNFIFAQFLVEEKRMAYQPLPKRNSL